MAFLSRLEGRNYKGYPTVDLDLPDSGIVFVVGANNAGKSALVSLVERVRGLHLPAEHLLQGASSGEVRAHFTLDPAEAQVLRAAEAWPPWVRDDTFTLSFRFCERHKVWDLQAVGGYQSNGSKIEVLFASEDSATHAVQRIMSGSEPHQVSLQNVATSQAGQHLTVDLQWLPPVRELFNGWATRIFHFHVLKRQVAAVGQLGGAHSLAVDGSNLLQVLLHLQHNDAAAWAELQALLRQVLPDVGELVIPIEGTVGNIAFRDSAGVRDSRLDELGTGVEQLLMTFAVALTQRPPHLVVLEEPESALHPAAQRALLWLLQRWSVDRLFLVTTHSPVFIDWAPARNPVVLVTREGGHSRAQDVTDEPKQVLSELGVRLSDVLAAESVLFVEGATDRDILASWFQKDLLDPRLAVVPTSGGDAARHARTMADWWAEADVAGPRRVLFLRDRDELADEEIAALEVGNRVHVLMVREIENFLLVGTGLASYLSQEAKQALDQSQVAEVLEACIEEQKPVVVLKRVLSRLRFPRIVDNALRAELSSGRAGLAELEAAVRERILKPEEVQRRTADLWAEQELAVAAAWPTERMALVAGADVLDAVFRRVLRRGYSKRGDGPELAKLIPPPEELRRILSELQPQP